MRSSVCRRPAGGREERSELTELSDFAAQSVLIEFAPLQRLLTVTHTFQKFPKITYNLTSNYYLKNCVIFFSNYGSQLRKNSLGINSTSFILQPMTEWSENYIWFSPNEALNNKLYKKCHSRETFSQCVLPAVAFSRMSQPKCQAVRVKYSSSTPGRFTAFWGNHCQQPISGAAAVNV